MVITLPRQIEIPDDTPIIEFVVRAHALGLTPASIKNGNGLQLVASDPFPPLTPGTPTKQGLEDERTR